MNTAVKTTEIIEAPEKPIVVLRNQLENMGAQFQAALPAHIPVERFKRVVMTAIQNNPDLVNADRHSLWNATMRAAQDGLLPDGREGAMVIYKNRVVVKGKDTWVAAVQWMPMIAGIRKKVRNSGEIATWDVHVVHAKDIFEFELGDDPFIKHKPFMGDAQTQDPGPVVAAYSVAVLKSGEKSREVMSRAQIDKVRGVSKSKDGPAWRDWYEEMCRKVVARRHSKVLPMSTDLDDLMRTDDELYNFREAREQDPGPDRPKLSEFMTPPKLAEEGETAGQPSGQSDEQVEQNAEQTQGDATDNSEASGSPSAADAFNLGRTSRGQGIALKAVPAEWRDEAHEPLATAWKAGWNERDAEIAAKVKGAPA